MEWSLSMCPPPPLDLEKERDAFYRLGHHQMDEWRKKERHATYAFWMQVAPDADAHAELKESVRERLWDELWQDCIKALSEHRVIREFVATNGQLQAAIKSHRSTERDCVKADLAVAEATDSGTDTIALQRAVGIAKKRVDHALTAMTEISSKLFASKEAVERVIWDTVVDLASAHSWARSNAADEGEKNFFARARELLANDLDKLLRLQAEKTRSELNDRDRKPFVAALLKHFEESGAKPATVAA